MAVVSAKWMIVVGLLVVVLALSVSTAQPADKERLLNELDVSIFVS